MLGILFIVFVSFTGSCKGDGVLPNDHLNASLGETVMFRTNLTPTETPFLSLAWTFGTNFTNVINSRLTSNLTAPEYEGRITLFRSTGSLELRNLKLSDSGQYDLTIIPVDDYHQNGKTKLDVYEPVSNVMLTSNSTDLIEFNSSVRLSCSSSGSNLSFLWMNSSSEVSTSDRVQVTDGGSILTIVGVTRYDQGPFRCHVSNPYSDGSSDSVNFMISYGPENVQLDVSPSGENHQEGSDVYLSCSAGSRPSATFSWFLSGNELLDSGPELKLENIQTDQSGSYSCQAFNNKTMRYQSSTPSTVTVDARISNVEITSNPKDLVEFNSSVLFSCSSSGFTPSFLWMNSSSEVSAGDRVEISSSDGGSNLTVFNVTRYDLGPFQCSAFNYFSDGSSDPVSLTVSYGPDNVQLDVSPSGENHQEGSDVYLSCSAGSRPSATFSWFLSGNEPLDSGPELKLENIQSDQSGSYSCQAFNSKTMRYQSSTPSTVTVDARISNVEITSNPKDLVEFNSSVLFSCSSSGFTPSFLWMNSSSEVSAGDRVEISSSDGGSNLTVFNVTRYDLGPFQCSASNYFSDGSSDPVSLTVSYGPEHVQLQVSPPDEHFETGSNIHMFCSADSVPSASFEWFHDGDLLPDSGSELKLIKVQTSQSGNYSCQAFNSKTFQSQTSHVSAILILEGSSELSAGVVAVIVIVCLVIVAGVCVGYYIHRRRKPSSNRNISTMTGGGRQDHAANSEELQYVDLKFSKKKKGKKVKEQLESTSANYAEIRVNSRPAAASSSNNQGPKYENTRLPNNERRTVEVNLENPSSNYAQVRVNSSRHPAPPPPTYKTHMQRAERPVPQPDADRAQVNAQGQNYADPKCRKTNAGWPEVEDTPTNYTQIRVNNNAPPAPPPPTYKKHMQQVKRPAPQPGNPQIYAQINKNLRR